MKALRRWGLHCAKCEVRMSLEPGRKGRTWCTMARYLEVMVKNTNTKTRMDWDDSRIEGIVLNPGEKMVRLGRLRFFLNRFYVGRLWRCRAGTLSWQKGFETEAVGGIGCLLRKCRAGFRRRPGLPDRRRSREVFRRNVSIWPFSRLVYLCRSSCVAVRKFSSRQCSQLSGQSICCRLSSQFALDGVDPISEFLDVTF